jgi:hypothetical protein
MKKGINIAFSFFDFSLVFRQQYCNELIFYVTAALVQVDNIPLYSIIRLDNKNAFPP